MTNDIVKRTMEINSDTAENPDMIILLTTPFSAYFVWQVENDQINKLRMAIVTTKFEKFLNLLKFSTLLVI